MKTTETHKHHKSLYQIGGKTASERDRVAIRVTETTNVALGLSKDLTNIAVDIPGVAPSQRL